jgi:hypothetical protein
VGRHQSNGVEGTNKQILRHLRTLVHDERSLKYWSQPQYYKMIEYYVNSFDNSETGVTPLHARFGSDAYKHLPIEPQIPITEFTNKYVKELDNNLQFLKNLSLNYQRTLVAKRTATSDSTYQNRYVPGDYVL